MPVAPKGFTAVRFRSKLGDVHTSSVPGGIADLWSAVAIAWTTRAIAP